jgi:hypothetical protein
MNSIINNWHEKGMHTSAEILRRDSSGKVKASGSSPVNGAEELDNMRRFLDELNKD